MSLKTKTKTKTTPVKHEPEWPDVLYVSGCSMLLSGFNGKYELRFDTYTGIISWHLDRHLYLGYWIRPTVIEYVGGHNWILRTDDYDKDVFYSFIGEKDKAPLGRWHGGVFVSTANDGFLRNLLAWWPIALAAVVTGAGLYFGFRLAAASVSTVAANKENISAFLEQDMKVGAAIGYSALLGLVVLLFCFLCK